MGKLRISLDRSGGASPPVGASGLKGKPVERFPRDVQQIGDPGAGNAPADQPPSCPDPGNPLCLLGRPPRRR